MCFIHAPVNLFKRFVRKLKNEHVFFVKMDGGMALLLLLLLLQLPSGPLKLRFLSCLVQTVIFMKRLWKENARLEHDLVLRFLDGDRSDCFFVIFGPNGDFD